MNVNFGIGSTPITTTHELPASNTDTTPDTDECQFYLDDLLCNLDDQYLLPHPGTTSQSTDHFDNIPFHNPVSDQNLSQEVSLDTFNPDNLPFILRYACHSDLLLSEPQTVTTTAPTIPGTLSVSITESGKSKSENAEKAKAAPFIKATGTTVRKKTGSIKARNVQYRKSKSLYICKIEMANGQVCNKGFAWPSNLTRHKETHFAKSYACDICHKHFAKQFDLIAHNRIHNLQPYLCITCNKRFKQLNDLSSHMYNHTENPDICTECGIGFSDRNIFQDHEKAHAKEKPIFCDICKKYCSSPSAFITHKRIHTGDKPYICPTCGKGFSQKVTLINHTTSHNSECLHICSVCGNSYKRKATLTIHQKQKHPQITR